MTDDARFTAWCRREESRLLAFPRQVTKDDGRAIVLDAIGGDSGQQAPAYLTARLAHAQALGALRGHDGCGEQARRLIGVLADDGPDWWTDLPHPGSARSLYALDHVLLAAATATTAGVPGAPDLLTVAADLLEQRYWDHDADRPIDHLDAQGRPAAYRGMNSTMHLTEALFAVWTATGDVRPRDRAIGLCRFALITAAERSMRLVEHFDADWNPIPEHHSGEPDHPFLPYGSTPGHGFEWSRLIAQAVGLPGTEGFAAGAGALYDRAAADCWRGPSAGLVYTVDWDGSPVSTRRLWWVAAEALAAASVLSRTPGGSSRSGSDLALWADEIERSFVDLPRGSWVHDLAQPDGPKNDLYHCLQAVLIPQLPVAPSVAAAITRG